MNIIVRKGSGVDVGAPKGAASAFVLLNNEKIQICNNSITGFEITPKITNLFPVSSENKEYKTTIEFDNGLQYQLTIIHNY